MSCVRCFFVLSFDEQTKPEECEQSIGNLPDYKSQYHLQIRKTACLNHTRNGNKSNSGNRGTNHGKGDDIPSRFTVSYKESFIVGFTSCYIRDSEQDYKVCHNSNGYKGSAQICYLKSYGDKKS